MAFSTKDGDRTACETTDAHPPIQTEEELELVKRYLLLGIVMRILDHDIKAIGRTPIKLPRLYESMLRGVQDRVLLDLAAIRQQFRKGGIKVYEQLQESDGLRARYVCRGYHHQFFMLWGFVKAESERVLRRYTSE
ncbi:hypothetical protein ACFSL6_04640 [Paenibacillus thailandensis]|uniref:Uncharacterized protein n=1 Tax=Paenibacillus thailandensis TaxID=393250 RepID=A0ABW5R0B4_9BACL